VTRRDAQLRKILNALEAEPLVSQRCLAARLGIALGLVNRLVRHCAARGWVEVRHENGSRPRYLLTARGREYRDAVSREWLEDRLQEYASARDAVRGRLGELLSDVEMSARSRPCSVVLVGTGELAEVAFLCLQRADVRLVGVVDDEHAGEMFLGRPVRPLSSLRGTTIDGEPYERLIFTRADGSEPVQRSLERLSIDPAIAFWL
jgi:DNA-binding MarR family transcriptional regulator